FVTPTPTTHTSTLSLHDALPIFPREEVSVVWSCDQRGAAAGTSGYKSCSGATPSCVARQLSIKPYPRRRFASRTRSAAPVAERRSEEHTSELQSRSDLVCRLLLE